MFPELYVAFEFCEVYLKEDVVKFRILPLEHSSTASVVSKMATMQHKIFFAFVSSVKVSLQLRCSVHFVVSLTSHLQRGRAFVVGINNAGRIRVYPHEGTESWESVSTHSLLQLQPEGVHWTSINFQIKCNLQNSNATYNSGNIANWNCVHLSESACTT
jgi:hypothetical protein